MFLVFVCYRHGDFWTQKSILCISSTANT